MFKRRAFVLKMVDADQVGPESERTSSDIPVIDINATTKVITKAVTHVVVVYVAVDTLRQIAINLTRLPSS
jgi:hypothetical protein